MHYLLSILLTLLFLASSAQFSKVENSEDVNYYQTFKQVIDSSYYYYWNSISESWEAHAKDSLVYDTLGILLNRFTFEINDAEKFFFSEKQQNAIDNLEIVATSYSYFVNNDWISDFQVINGANSDTSFVFDTSSNQFVYQYYSDYEFNVSNQKTVNTEYFWDTASLSWVNYSKIEYTYEPNYTTELVYNWDTVNDAWFQSSKYIYHYIDDNNYDTLLFQTYDTSTEVWTNNQRYIIAFMDGIEISKTLQFYDVDWINFSKDSTIYSVDGKVEQLLRMYWNTNVNIFKNYSRNLYAYNYLGNLNEDVFQLWNETDEIWENTNRVLNYYSEIVCTVSAEIVESKSITCYEANNGEITLRIDGGTEPYEISWSDFDNADLSQTGIEANKYYTVTITDANQCVFIDSIQITQPDSLVIETAEISDVSCFGGNDAFIKINAMGGTSDYSFLWNDDNATSKDSLVNIEAGEYAVTVVDANNCIALASFTVNEPTELFVNLVDTSDATCNGYNDGTASIAGIGGTQPYNYYWPQLEVADSFVNNLYAGIYYYFEISDANGCESIDSVIVFEPDPVLTSEITGLDSVFVNDLVEYSVEATENSFYYWSAELGTVKYGNGTNVILVEWDAVGNGQVAVIEENATGCFGDTIYFDIRVDQAIGIDESEAETVDIFPNPFSNQLNVKMKGEIIAESYQLVDISGKTLQMKENLKAKEFIIKRKDLKSGMYYLRIKADKIYIYKVIIE